MPEATIGTPRPSRSLPVATYAARRSLQRPPDVRLDVPRRRRHRLRPLGQPTWSAFEAALGELEGGQCVSFASGLAAVSAMLSSLPLGATVVYPRNGYNGTRGLLERLEKEARLHTRAVDVVDTPAVLGQLEGADMLWLESPTNPLLGVADLADDSASGP